MVGIPTPTAPGGSAPGGCPLPPEPRAFAVAERQGEPYWTADTVTVVKAAPAGTGGRLAVVEQLLVAGRPRAVRRNPDGDEVWYVLDGILDVDIELLFFEDALLEHIKRVVRRKSLDVPGLVALLFKRIEVHVFI